VTIPATASCIIVFLGPPASGKGTQAASLAERTGMGLVVTGEMLRRNVAAGTPTGLEAKSFMDQGLLVPDHLLNRMVGETLREPGYLKGVILDGYPRNMAQAEFLTSQLDAAGRCISHALLIEVPDEQLVRRQAGRLVCRTCGTVYNKYLLPPPSEGACACGGELYQRSDDTEDVIRKRLAVYRDNTAPLVEYYEDLGVLRRVNGEGTPAEVQAAVLTQLEAKQEQP